MATSENDKNILYCLSSTEVGCKRNMVRVFNKMLTAKALGPNTRRISENRRVRLLSIARCDLRGNSGHLFSECVYAAKDSYDESRLTRTNNLEGDIAREAVNYVPPYFAL